MTDPLGQSQVLPYLERLASIGYQITLLSFEKPERYAKFEKVIRQKVDACQIDWRPLAYTKNPPVLSTILDLLKGYFLVIRLHRKKQFCLVHCRGYLTSLIGLWLKKRKGVRFVFDMRGFFADERVEGGLWKLKHPLYRSIYRFFKKKEKEFLTQADYIISLTHKGKEIIEQQLCPDVKLPIEVIPCCADLCRFDYRRFDREYRRQKRKQLNISDELLVIGYSGSVGTWYLLDAMLDFFEVLLRHKSNSVFLFITHEAPDTILSVARKKNIDANKIRVLSVPFAEVPDYLMVMDVAVFFIKPVFSKMASSPTKQGELMGMGIPIICNDGIGDTGSIIRDCEAGMVISGFTEQDYLAAAAHIEKLMHIDREKIRKGAEKYYSLEQGVEKYAKVYEKLLSH